MTPFFSTAWHMYSEHVGSNRQACGNQGEIKRLYTRRTKRMALFIVSLSLAHPAHGGLELRAQRVEGDRGAVTLGVYHEIEMMWDVIAGPSKDFPETALDTISDHGISDPARNRNPKPVMLHTIRQPEEDETSRMHLPAAIVNSLVVRRSRYSISFRKSFVGFSSHSRSASFALSPDDVSEPAGPLWSTCAREIRGSFFAGCCWAGMSSSW